MDTRLQDRPRVLIVDDQPNWLNALRDMLDSTKYEIETAISYDKAELELKQRAFHVVVTDQRLVDEDETNIQGIHLLDKVNEFQDGTRTIVVTGYPTIDAAKKALKGRAASDYLLKYPEKEEKEEKEKKQEKEKSFDIKEYRKRVEEIAKEATQARQKITTLKFSVSDIIQSLSYEQIAEIIFPEGANVPDAPGSVKVVMNRLLYPFQPLARQMGKTWQSGSESNRIFEILCWSRNQGQAVVLEIGREHSSFQAGQIWNKYERQYPCKKKDQYASAPIVGASYIIDELTFKDFEALVKAV